MYVCMYVYIKKLLVNEIMKLKVYSKTQTLGLAKNTAKFLK